MNLLAIGPTILRAEIDVLEVILKNGGLLKDCDG